MKIQPFNAPSVAMIAAAAIMGRAEAPQKVPAASAKGALESINTSGGRTPITAMEPNKYTAIVSTVPHTLARPIFRSGSRILPLQIAAVSTPRKANRVSVVAAVIPPKTLLPWVPAAQPMHYEEPETWVNSFFVNLHCDRALEAETKMLADAKRYITDS